MTEWFLAQDGVWVYIGIFLLLLGGAVGLPIPEDVPLILGGIILSHERAADLPMFLVCYAGTLLGDLLIYGVGRRFGGSITKFRWFAIRVTDEKIAVAKKSLERRSLITIFVARHLFYLRTLTFLSCGIVKMSFVKFFVSDAVAALVSVPLMLSLGYIAAENYDAVFSGIARAKEISVVVGVIVLLYVLWKIRQRHQAKPPELN